MIKVYLIIIIISINSNTHCQSIVFSGNFLDNAEVFYKTKYIPRVIKKDLRKLWGHNERIINPNRPYQGSDHIINPFLAKKRLVFLVKAKNYYILVYEHGGRGSSTDCLGCN